MKMAWINYKKPILIFLLQGLKSDLFESEIPSETLSLKISSACLNNVISNTIRGRNC